MILRDTQNVQATVLKSTDCSRFYSCLAIYVINTIFFYSKIKVYRKPGYRVRVTD
jgi:hypothetical protein